MANPHYCVPFQRIFNIHAEQAGPLLLKPCWNSLGVWGAESRPSTRFFFLMARSTSNRII